MDRTTTTEGTLARLGFGDPHRAAETLDAWFAEHGDGCGALVVQVIASADPDLALNGLTRLDAARPDLLAALVAEPEWGERVCRVLGASVALNQHLGAHPADVDVLRGPIERRAVTGLRAAGLCPIGADPGGGPGRTL